MKDGLYHFCYTSSTKVQCSGVVTVIKGKINGGFSDCFFQGDIQGSSAIIKLTRLSDSIIHHYTTAGCFYMDLRVRKVMGSEVLDGHVIGKQNLQVQIHTRFLAPLA